jgi:hypothetical protein
MSTALLASGTGRSFEMQLYHMEATDSALRVVR